MQVQKRIRWMHLLIGLLALVNLGFAAAADDRLSVAAMNGDLQTVQSLLQAGADVNGAQGDGTTALHWAASRDDLDITRVLLAAKANVEAKTRLNQMTPLFMAAKNGNAPIVEALLKAGADAKAATNVGTTALMLAAAAGSPEAVQALLKAGADIHGKDVNQGQTALMFAAASGRTEVIRLLASSGADLNARSLVPTRMKGTAQASFPARPNAPTSVADAGGRRRAATEKPLALGGMSALHFAAREGHFETLRALVEAGADVNLTTASDQMTTLTLAVVNGRFDMAKYLLERGADPKPASAEQATALFVTMDTRWAPRGWYPAPVLDSEKVDYLELMGLMLDKGADINARMNGRMWMRIVGPGGGPVYTGETAFLRAAQANDVPAMKFLLARGANPTITTSGGVDALMLASGAGHRPSEGHVKADARMETVRFLVEDLGFDVNAKDKNGFTPLHGAASIGDKDVINYLVAYGGDVAARADVFAERSITEVAPAKPGSGETIADMANGPGEKTLVYTDVVDMLIQLGSGFSDNCRAALCVNKARPDRPRPSEATSAPEAQPASPAPDAKKPEAPKKGGRG